MLLKNLGGGRKEEEEEEVEREEGEEGDEEEEREEEKERGGFQTHLASQHSTVTKARKQKKGKENLWFHILNE